MKNTAFFRPSALVLATLATISTGVYAAGFQLTEQSALGLGRAYAGIGVDGADISGAYYNPATMTLHSGTNVQTGAVLVDLNLDYEGKNGETENGRDKGKAIPHLYLTHQFNDQLYAGLAITAPFGMQTSYGANWGLANRGYFSKIEVIDVNPSLAWKINDTWSVGVGVSYQYVDASLETKQQVALPNGGTLPLYADLEADNSHWGWNVGVMYRPAENLRFGLSYRSEVKHTAKGTLSVTSGQAQIDQMLKGKGAPVGEMSAQASVSAPAWAMLSAAWDVNADWSLYGTLRWSDWSSFNRLAIETNGKEAHAIENNWRDTYLMSVGADWRLSPQWTVRAGVGYETSPIKDAKTRTGVIPDAARLWFGLGASYKFNDHFTVDVGGAHLHGVGERDLYNTAGDKVGRYKKLDAYLLGAQLQYHF